MNKYTIGILVLVILLGTALFFAPDGKKTEQKKKSHPSSLRSLSRMISATLIYSEER